MKKRMSWISVVLVVVFVAIISVFGYKFGKEFIGSLSSSSFQTLISGKTTPLFTGSLTRISDDLGLFKPDEFSQEDGYVASKMYYQAGVFTTGTYKGYERIIALRDQIGPGTPVSFILATKDRKTYILHDPTHAAKRFPDTDWQSPFVYIEKTKIAKTDTLPSEHPETIPFDTSFALFQDALVTENVSSGNVNKDGYDIYENRIRTDFSSYESLTIPKFDRPLYGVVNPPVQIPDQWEEDAKVQAQLRAKYIKGTTGVVVLDSTGLPYSYTLSWPDEISSYQKKYNAYLDAMVVYEKERVRFENKEIADSPEYPTMPSLPNLRFNGSDVKGAGELFNTYDIAVPYMCGTDVSIPVIQNIADNEFLAFGTVFGQQVYTLKDPEHPFYKLAYRNKLLMSQEEFDVINKDMEKLSYENYVAKHPLLFFKDFWGRWVVVGEYDYKMIGGCGKPVLYLYPQEATDVSVSFAKPMELTVTIPAYQADWYVRAYPDGTLVDLVPEHTNCASLDTTRHGSEYAQDACRKNTYPYLYWAGNRVGAVYPVLDKNIGWVVSRESLWSFLDTTVTTIGFTQKEKDDFLSYWVPVLLEKQVPWYHLRFLQTSDMNAFVPMNIHPQPDRYYRLFLDWQPLSEPLSMPIVPQQLDRIIRTGFTIVEWGGLKR